MDHLTRLRSFFPVGTQVRCIVVSTDSTKHGHSKIKLSINPDHVNCSLSAASLCPNMVVSGYVRDVEDHGYSVSIGVKGVQGFLPDKDLEGTSCYIVYEETVLFLCSLIFML